MAIVANEIKARLSPCTCYKIDPNKPPTPENLLCFSEGMIGTLTDAQEREYCPKKTIREASPEYQNHIQKFSLLGKIMKKCGHIKDKHDFLVCVGHEAEKLRISQ